MDLNEIAVFVKVIQAGSFSRAAQQLGMPNSTVSAKVSALEKRLGVTLIQRTTRKLHITPAGQAYFNRCVHGLDEIMGAEAEVASAQSEPQGRLRITAPVELGSSVLPGLVADFSSQYPKVKLEVLLTDRMVDLVAEGIDLAIRAGELKDSSLIAKKLGSIYFAPFASRNYLKAVGKPTHPKDLRSHRCVQFAPLGTQEWKLIGPKTSVTVPLQGSLIINDLNMVKALTLSDGGVALLPTFFCYPEVRSGQLVRLLPDWRTGLTPVHYVYPAQKFVLPKLSVFMDKASEALKRNFQSFEL